MNYLWGKDVFNLWFVARISSCIQKGNKPKVGSKKFQDLNLCPIFHLIPSWVTIRYSSDFLWFCLKPWRLRLYMKVKMVIFWSVQISLRNAKFTLWRSCLEQGWAIINILQPYSKMDRASLWMNILRWFCSSCPPSWVGFYVWLWCNVCPSSWSFCALHILVLVHN